MDWMTLAIEILGAAIFCVWVVIPVREYKSIYQRLRHKPPSVDPSAAHRESRP